MHSMFVFGLMLCLAQTSWADGGAIQFQGETGSFHVTVFTLPPILTAGPVDVTVLIQDRSKLVPVLDERVTFDLSEQAGNNLHREAWIPPACALNEPLSLVDIQARLGHGENRLLYGAVVQIPSSGIWKLKVNIQHNSETESVSTLLKVNPPPPPPLAYWHLFILPPLVVLGFIVNRTARHKPGIRSQKSVAGVQKCADFDLSIFGSSSLSDPVSLHGDLSSVAYFFSRWRPKVERVDQSKISFLRQRRSQLLCGW